MLHAYASYHVPSGNPPSRPHSVLVISSLTVRWTGTSFELNQDLAMLSKIYKRKLTLVPTEIRLPPGGMHKISWKYRVYRNRSSKHLFCSILRVELINATSHPVSSLRKENWDMPVAPCPYHWMRCRDCAHGPNEVKCCWYYSQQSSTKYCVQPGIIYLYWYRKF